MKAKRKKGNKRDIINAWDIIKQDNKRKSNFTTIILNERKPEKQYNN